MVLWGWLYRDNGKENGSWRGLYVTRPIAQREVILRDVAVVDSVCSQDLISRIFSSQPPGESRSKREPIWGLVANFVLLLLQDHWYRPQMRENLAALAYPIQPKRIGVLLRIRLQQREHVVEQRHTLK